MSAASGSVKRRGVFLRIVLTDGTVLGFWLGFGDVAVPVNELDLDGQTYVGLGILASVPQLQALLNGIAARAEFSLSGVPASIAAFADGDAEYVRGAQVNVGVCKFDGGWQFDGTVLWLWDGRADFLSTAMSSDGSGNQTYAVRISVGTAQTGRARPEFQNWTDAQQQRAHAGDTGLDHVPTGEATKRWPGG